MALLRLFCLVIGVWVGHVFLVLYVDPWPVCMSNDTANVIVTFRIVLL